ncbi:tRNA-dihydrouridine synthase [Vitreoscilla sp. C1]|uniref:tRNA dihydrouridine synthase n=1 Tax=Vitreoscilla sp. (strain C1) TaxID=96942 RepID=UPI000CDC7B65|nr:tRNA-dihydrouridine synthase [Vitreoscilla sp. C1]AUZ04580.1 tRNA-dihydrouridine synthase [Vitreoscilla sp. C1]
MRLILAPMQGLVDDVMRDLLTRMGGLDACVSEFVRITHTVHGRGMWMKLIPELEHDAKTFAGVPCTVQILGSDAENMALNALEAVRYGAQKIDINFGCPAPTVNRHQGGAVLLKEPERMLEIVSTVRQALPELVPLSAKMRLGYESKDLFLDCAQAIADGGACEVAVHARTKIEGYEPPAHWQYIHRIREALNIPVIANGDVFSLDDYIAIKAQSGCDSVMLGRGAVRRPDLARQIMLYEQGQTVTEMDWPEIMHWVRLFFELCCIKAGDSKYPMARLKQWVAMMKLVYPQAHVLFEAIRPLKGNDEIRTVLKAS